MGFIDIEFKVYRPLIENLAKQTCVKVSESVIRQLKKIQASGAIGDCGVKNVWEELCIVMNDGSSDSQIWDAYMLDVDQRVHSALIQQNLEPWQMTAIWLQTQSGDDWVDKLFKDVEVFEELTYCEDEVIQHIRDNFVCNVAMDYSNKRLQNYFDGQYEMDYSDED
jgi:hypothetical protein